MFGQVKNLCAFSFCTKSPKNIFDCYSNYSFFLRNCFPLSFLCVFLFVVLFIFTPFNPKMVYSFFISFCVFFLVCVIVLFCHKFKDKESKLQNFTFYDTQKSETSISLNWIKWDESFFFCTREHFSWERADNVRISLSLENWVQNDWLEWHLKLLER